MTGNSEANVSLTYTTDRSWPHALVVLVCFGAYHALFTQFAPIKTFLDRFVDIGLVSYVATYVLIGIPVVVGTRIVYPHALTFCQLGFCRSLRSALLLSALFALPMFVGGWLMFRFVPVADWQTLAARTIVAGFFEEIYFRAFLFGLLFRRTPLGFVPATTVGALIFGLGHLWQGDGVTEALGVFAVTFMGGVLFAWLYTEWEFNLWIPIFLHTLMNLAWELFAMDNTALGGSGANVLRATTIAIAIVFTLRYKRRSSQALFVNRATLWRQHDS
jgi:membrane protease YdiL (CAAX protease family)